MFILVACIGLWFRFFRIEGSLWMLQGYDESRDMLVARHIIEYGDWIWRGPLSSGSMNQLMNSPMYYYFMAFLWFIGRSPVAVSVLWSCVLMSTVYFSYRIGTMIWDKRLGLIMAVFFAVQPTLISNSRHISQPYLLPLFFTIFLWLFWSKSPMTLAKFCLFIFILMAPMHIHYGSLLMLPAGFLWLGLEWLGYMKENKPHVHLWFVPLLVAEYFLVVWVWFTFSSAPFDQQFFLLGEMRRTWLSLITQIQNAGIAMLDNLWWGKDPLIVIGILVFFIGITAWYLRKRYSIDASVARKYWWMVAFVVVPPLVAGFHGDIVHTSYMLSTLPVLIVFIAIGVRVIMAMNRYVAWVCIFIALWIFAEQSLTEIRDVPVKSYYRKIQEISQVIYENYSAQEPANESEPKIALAVLAGPYLPYDGWGTAALWYFLEDAFGRRLVALRDQGENFSQVIRPASYFYVLCDYRGLWREPANVCTDKFRSIRKYLMAGEQKIYASEEFEVWRFGIDPSIPAGVYNMVYPE